MTLRITPLRALPALVGLAAITLAAADQAGPALRIASPAEGTYVNGPTRLVAMIDPPPSAKLVKQVTFFADARQVCVVQRPPFECEWDAGERITEHQVRAVATLNDGRRLVQTVRTKGVSHAEEVDVDVVQVTAVVTDGDGRFVKGLTQKDFKVFEDDREQPITHFAAENIPLELVAALDVSSSMTDALPRLKEAAKTFLEGLRSDDQVTLLAFNENIFMPARRSTDKVVRARAIDRMEPWGGTALYDVIIKAVELLGRQSGRRSIVLFSDGDDQSSHSPLEAAIARTEGSDATIYVIGQGRAVKVAELQALMNRLASVSGGRAFFTDDIGRLDGIFVEILEDLRNQYLLSYPTPSSQRDGAWHKIRVEVSGGRHKVRAREGYRLVKARMGAAVGLRVP